MSKKLDINLLDNPNIQVIWQDSPENFTQERIKSVRNYFIKKYGTNNVNIITKVNVSEDIKQTVDVSTNVMDKNYQKDLIKNLLESKGQEGLYDQVIEIDNQVENRILANDIEITQFKKWYIKKIKFSNFLSFGENQEIDFDKHNGIVIIESDPQNFGGKSTLSVDLLLFLFFNTTTKTQKAEEIFNKFTDKDYVKVSGEIVIDGEEYLIAREITRKKSKSGGWTVKTDLDFFKKLSDGELINFTGEQRRETEEFIKKSIGNMDDFLMTILTTGSNLEDLLNSKPTSRGETFARFLGLEFIKKKEEIGKEIYSNFSKTMLSNVYNSENLKQKIEDSRNRINDLTEENSSLNEKIADVDDRLTKGQEYKENLLKQKFNDLDQDLLIADPKNINEDILKYENECKKLRELISNTKVEQPTEYYKEENHDQVKELLTNSKIEYGNVNSRITEINGLVSKYGNGIECEHCGLKLIDAELTKNKINELDGLKEKLKEVDKKIKKLTEEDQSYAALKKEFDDYEKNKLIKEKHELSLESFSLKMEKSKDTLKRYEDVQDKIRRNKEIEGQVIKANMRIDELVSEKRGYDRQQASNLNEIEKLKDSINQNQEKIIEINEEFEKEKIYKTYIEIFGKNGISKLIMKTMMPIINQELQRLLQDSCYFNLEVRINDKNEVEFVMIDNSTGVEKPMTSGSGYEKTIASLALRSVLTKVCSLPKPNIVVMDEVFGKISNDNLELIGEFFTKIKTYFEKIFVISHNPLISNWGDSFIKVTKVNNVSKIL
jgi:DNA repair exonuclease SbcCD ATPase subunit